MKRTLTTALALLIGTFPLFAQEADAATVQENLNYVWTIIAACMVFFMQAGFTLVETGFTRAKNALNIVMKNVMDVSAGGLAFFFIGFGLMFGTTAGGWIGTDGFALIEIGDHPAEWSWTFFFFQAVFAATAATIVSGSVAERTSFKAYLIFSIIITAFIYPVFGSWAWGSLFNGSGWLEDVGGLSLIDFAGSTVVHSVGGWAALAGALVVGPRVGKYIDNVPQEIKGHSLPLAALGVFILWLGWFGFNAGSTTTGDASIALIAINTFLAAAAGATAAMLITWFTTGKPDGAVTLNGVLAGLVGITAGCANLTPVFAIVTGALAGILVHYSMKFLEKHVDDAVGAVSVHGVCGAWGTLAAGMFNTGDLFNLEQIGVQMIGIGAAFVWAFGVSYLVFKLIDVVTPLRVSEDLEEKGLDIMEHDAESYPEFIPS